MEAKDLEDLAAAAEEQRDRERKAQADLEATLAELSQVRERDRELGAELDRERQALQECRGQLGSLEALQEAALGQGAGQVVEWLAGRGLEGHPRLAQQLRVEAGWERAVETVLGAYLEAVCVDGLDGVTGALDSLTHGAVTFLESRTLDPVPREGEYLLAKVTGPGSAGSLLAGVRTANSLGEALAIRHRLAAGESVITREGIWLGPNWLRVSREADPKSGVLAREDEIRVLRDRIGTLSGRVDDLGREHLEARERQKTLDARRDELQQEANATHRQHANLNAQLENLKARLEQNQARLQKLADEGAEVAEQIGDLEDKLRRSRQALEQALSLMGAHEDRRTGLVEEREQLEVAVTKARERADADRLAAQEIAIKVESRRSSMDSASVSIDRLREQLTLFSRRKDDLEQQLEDGVQPLQEAQESLSGLLDQRVAVETELGEARRAQQASETRLREEQEKRVAKERAVEAVRQGLDELKLGLRETSVRLQTIQEQFAETGFEVSNLREELDADAAIGPWEEELERLQSRIQRLGPINLASIDELKEQSERKEYLDAQFADLTDALTTLENAMRKIDRETRTRFKETFDKVNAGLKDLFPRLFGGGHAYLELGDEDLLHAGVTVMARPPGKRNSTIHLLSGGEKALTAVALVFSIFQLNPAPFCMLDEVDAPLDDANVGRYCDIVRQMSDHVQFIFITHNKTTMEMSRQLTGVTMNEPGVSRLVAVDVDEAVQMAAV
jgi:chromosome segregation protein